MACRTGLRGVDRAPPPRAVTTVAIAKTKGRTVVQQIMRTTRRAFSIAALACVSVLATPFVARAGDGVVVTFTTGTGDAPGKITVTNASNGSTATVGLIPKLSAEACAAMLSTAAPKVGFKAELTGASVTVLGRGVVVKVDGASITKTDK
jgi:hypothetical protein